MLQPTLDNVVVLKAEGQKQSAGGILLPDNMKRETFTGEVVAVGPGRYADGSFLPTCPVPDQFKDFQGKPVPQPGVKVGDVAVFNQYAGNKVKVAEVEYLILQADEVLAILPPEPAAPIPESDR